MSIEENEALAFRFFQEVSNEGNLRPAGRDTLARFC